MIKCRHDIAEETCAFCSPRVVERARAKRNGWSEEDVEFVMDPDFTDEDVAAVTGRSVGAVNRFRARILKHMDTLIYHRTYQATTVPGATRRGESWDAVEDEAVLAAQRGELVNVALKLGRSYAAVVGRRRILREVEDD